MSMAKINCFRCNCPFVRKEDAFTYCFCEPENPRHVFHLSCLERAAHRVAFGICKKTTLEQIECSNGWLVRPKSWQFPFMCGKFLSCPSFKAYFFLLKTVGLLVYNVCMFPRDLMKFIKAMILFFPMLISAISTRHYEFIYDFAKEVTMPILHLVLVYNGFRVNGRKLLDWFQLVWVVNIKREEPHPLEHHWLAARRRRGQEG